MNDLAEGDIIKKTNQKSEEGANNEKEGVPANPCA